MKLFKRTVKPGPRHASVANEESRDTIRQRQREAFTSYAFYVEGARFQVTSEPTFNAQRALLQTTAEGHAFTYAHYKLNQIAMTGAPMSDLYIWDLGAPSGTVNPIARFHYDEATHTVEHN